MSAETKKSYGTWEEAVEEFKRNLQAAMQAGMTKMQAKLQAEMDESFSNFIVATNNKMMKELEPAIIVKIDQVIAEEVSSASIEKVENETIFVEEKKINCVQSNLKIESKYILINEELIDNDFDEEIVFSESIIEICNQAIDIDIAEKFILQNVINVKLGSVMDELFSISNEFKLKSTKEVVFANGTIGDVMRMSTFVFEKSQYDFSARIHLGRRIWNPGIFIRSCCGFFLVFKF